MLKYRYFYIVKLVLYLGFGGTLALANSSDSEINAEENQQNKILGELSASNEPLAEFVLTEEEQLWLSEHPVLRVMNNMDTRPIDYTQGSEPMGFSVEYLELIAEKVGFRIEWVNGYSWTELLEMLERRELDIAHGLGQTEDRDKYLLFTDPYIALPIAYFGREGGEPVTKLADFVGKKIGTVKGYARNEVYRRYYPDLELVEFNAPKDAFIALSNGQIDIFADSLPTGNYIVAKFFIPNIAILGMEFLPEMENDVQLRVGSRSDWPELNAILKKAVASISDSEILLLSDKWQAGLSGEDDIGLSQEEVAWLSENNIIKVAADPNLAPLEFVNPDGSIGGIAGGYLEILSDKLNVEFQWAGSENWNEALAMIQNGEAHMLSTVTPTPSRRRYIDFTDDYMTPSNVIFARDGTATFGNMDALNGFTIVQIKDSAILEFIKQDYPDIQVEEVESVAEALHRLSGGSVDAYVGSVIDSSYYLAQEGISNISVVGETPYIGSNAMGVRADLPLLSSALQKAIRSIPQNQRAAITRDWLSLQIESRVNYDLVWQILASALAVIMLGLLWIRSLRSEVKHRREVEKKLIKSQELAKTSQQQAEKARAEAVAANNAKSAFLANMSHEIRTPLNAIIGFSDMILSGAYGSVKVPKHEEYLHYIKGSGEHLSVVIKDILDLSKIEAGKWHLQETDFSVNDCLDEAVKMLELQARKKHIELVNVTNGECKDVKIHGDINAIKRSIINLLSNSVKFTGEYGKIVCKAINETDKSLTILVNDNGIGIPPDRLEQVLKPFEQIHEEYDLNDEGTGLGLPIVKRLIELHQGKFFLTSTVDVGTEAHISIPAQRVIA